MAGPPPSVSGSGSSSAELRCYALENVSGLDAFDRRGSGAYGVVFKVTVGNVPCIAKRLHDVLVNKEVSRDQKAAIRQRFRKECATLSDLKHPNIVHFVGVHFGRGGEDDLSLVMECLQMDVAEFVERRQNIPLSIKVSILHDVTYGLLYLHSLGIIHRDLTAQNVLLTQDLRAKIADLGVATLIDIRVCARTVAPGNRDYMPPEALMENAVYDKKIDVFSFGHLTLHIVTQDFPEVFTLPYATIMSSQNQTEIQRRRKAFDHLGRDHCLHPLATQCLLDNPDERPATEVINRSLRELTIAHPKTLAELMQVVEPQRFVQEVVVREEVVAREEAWTLTSAGLMREPDHVTGPLSHVTAKPSHVTKDPNCAATSLVTKSSDHVTAVPSHVTDTTDYGPELKPDFQESAEQVEKREAEEKHRASIKAKAEQKSDADKRTAADSSEASQQARADQLEKCDAEISHLKRELAASEAECRAIRTQFDAVTYDRAVIQSENTYLQRQVEDLQCQVMALRQRCPRCGDLEEQLTVMETQASIYKSDFDTERHDRAEAVGRMDELQRRHDDQCSTKEAAEKELREVRKKIKAMQENFHRDVDYHRRRTEDLSSELQLRKVEATSAIEECDRKQSSLNSKDARIVILEAQHEELCTLNRQLSNRVERARQDSVDSEKSSVHTPSVYGSPDQSLKLPDRVPQHKLPDRVPQHEQPGYVPPHKQPDPVPPHEQPGYVLPDSVPPREPPGRTTTERLNELSVRVAELEEMHIRDREECDVLHKAKQVLEEQNQRLVRVTTEHGLDPSGGGGGGGGGGGQQQLLINRQDSDEATARDPQPFYKGQLSASMPRMQQAMKESMLEQRSRSVGSKSAAFQRDGKSYVGDSPPIVEGEVFQTPPSQAPLNHTQQPDLKGFDTPPPTPAPAPPFSSQEKPQQQFDYPVQKPKMRFANPQASQSSQSAEYANYPTNQGPQSMRPADQYTPASSEQRQQVRPQLLYQGDESRQQKRQQHPQRGGYNQFGSQGGPNASPLHVSTPTPQHASLAGYNHQSLASNQRGGFMSLNPAGFQATAADLQFQAHARQPPDVCYSDQDVLQMHAVRGQARGGRYGTDQRAHIFREGRSISYDEGYNSEDLLSYPRDPNRQHVPRSMSRIEEQEDEIETQSLPVYSLPPNALQMSAEDYQEFVAFKYFQQQKLAAIQQQPGSEGRRKQQHSVRNLGPEFEKQSSKRGVARGYPPAEMIAGEGEEGGARSDPTVEENTLSKGIDTDIHRVAGDLALQQQQRGGGGGGEPPSSEGPDIVSPPPLDPNLVCQHCGRGYRVLEIQLFRRHVEQCAGGGGGGGGGRETPHAQHLGSAEWQQQQQQQ